LKKIEAVYKNGCIFVAAILQYKNNFYEQIIIHELLEENKIPISGNTIYNLSRKYFSQLFQ
jgi:hypothetical protein